MRKNLTVVGLPRARPRTNGRIRKIETTLGIGAPPPLPAENMLGASLPASVRAELRYAYPHHVNFDIVYTDKDPTGFYIKPPGGKTTSFASYIKGHLHDSRIIAVEIKQVVLAGSDGFFALAGGGYVENALNAMDAPYTFLNVMTKGKMARKDALWVVGLDGMQFAELTWRTQHVHPDPYPTGISMSMRFWARYSPASYHGYTVNPRTILDD